MNLGKKRGLFFKFLVALVIGVPLLWGLAGADIPSKSSVGLAFLSGSQSEASAPDFELPDLNGYTVRLSDFQDNRPVMIYFWATWCPHCVQARPSIVRLREKIEENELGILGINVGAGDSLERVKRFQKGHPVSWPVLYDKDGEVSKAYGVQGIPLFVLLNSKGDIVYRGYEMPENPKQYLQ